MDAVSMYSTSNSVLRRLVRQELASRGREKATNEVSDLIPGLSNVLTRKRVVQCRFLWTCLIVVCVGMTIYQMYDRIQFYFMYPVKTFITTEKPNEFQFPAILICTFHSSELTDLINKESKVYKTRICLFELYEIMQMNLTLNKLWQLNDAMKEFNITINKPNEERIPFTDVSPYPVGIGNCMRIKIREKFPFAGPDMNVEILRKKGVCKLFENIFSLSPLDDSLNIRSAYYVGNNMDAQMIINYKRITRQNSPRKRCISMKESSECYDKCYLQMIRQSKPICRLPYMTELTNLRMCEEFHEAQTAHLKVWHMMLRLNRQSDCNCDFICDEKIFSLVRRPINFELENLTRLRFFYGEDKFERLVEEFSYDFISLICDIGGNLGLYLGLSILSIFELFESVVKLTRILVT